MRTSDEELSLAPVDDDPLSRADPPAVVFGRNAVLQFHNRVGPPLFHLVRYVVAQPHGRIGALFFRVREDSEPFEPHPFDKFQQFVEIRFAFARIAGQQRRPQRDAGNPAAQFADQFVGLRLVQPAAHTFQLRVADVLKRDVEVFAHFRFVAQRVDHVRRELRRVGVV